MHIYNKTSGKCETLPETICIRDASHGVFYSLYDCILTCAPGQAASWCEKPPYQKCNSTSILETALFYNVSTQECKRYPYCENPAKIPFGENGFATLHHCNLACRGFNTYNVKGWKEPQCGVFCGAQPHSVCDEEDYDAGLTRYYYNATCNTCEMYKACDWDDDLKEVNYFATRELCELQCG
ncbi:hypothetical protein V5799_007745, partial [Amblyomma americanum]